MGSFYSYVAVVRNTTWRKPEILYVEETQFFKSKEVTHKLFVLFFFVASSCLERCRYSARSE
jgi:hypothetical protein